MAHAGEDWAAHLERLLEGDLGGEAERRRELDAARCRAAVEAEGLGRLDAQRRIRGVHQVQEVAGVRKLEPVGGRDVERPGHVDGGRAEEHHARWIQQVEVCIRDRPGAKRAEYPRCVAPGHPRDHVRERGRVAGIGKELGRVATADVELAEAVEEVRAQPLAQAPGQLVQGAPGHGRVELRVCRTGPDRSVEGDERLGSARDREQQRSQQQGGESSRHEGRRHSTWLADSACRRGSGAAFR